jgi:hypothetical protein
VASGRFVIATGEVVADVGEAVGVGNLAEGKISAV